MKQPRVGSTPESMNKLPKNRNKADDAVAPLTTQLGESPAEPKPDTESEPVTSNHQSLPKIISFETLARCGEEIWIENGGQIYRLRRTRQGKLILTK